MDSSQQSDSGCLNIIGSQTIIVVLEIIIHSINHNAEQRCTYREPGGMTRLENNVT